jgi:predicted nuclease with RNAse H fold
MTDPLVVGIDVAATRPCVAVALRVGRTLSADGGQAWWATNDLSELVAWLRQRQPTVIAIDAPQGFNRRLLLSGRPGQLSHRSRVCDYELLRRRISVYQVPTRQEAEEDKSRLPAWMQVGFDLFRAVRRLGYEAGEPGDMPGSFARPKAVLEAYPYASFVTLQGGLLPKKTTRDGQFLRLRLLRRAGVEWDDYFDHDSLDALAVALTAARALQGRATALGDQREGYLWLPISRHDLRDKYEPATLPATLA